MRWRLIPVNVLLIFALYPLAACLGVLASGKWAMAGPVSVPLDGRGRLTLGVHEGWPFLEFDNQTSTPTGRTTHGLGSFAGLHWAHTRSAAGLHGSLRVHPLLGVVVSLTLILLGLRLRRRLSLTPIGYCPKCAYDLRGTPGRCTECGWAARGARIRETPLTGRLPQHVEIPRAGFSTTPI